MLRRTGTRAVLFDAVGTLIYAEPPVAAAYSQCGQKFGSTLSVGGVATRFAAAFARQERVDQQASRVTSQSRERQRWREIVGEVLSDVDASDELFEALWTHFAQAASWSVFDDVAATLQFLSERGFVIGVASNFDDRLIELCRRLPELDRCRHVFTSAQIGYSKPAPEFFLTIADQLGLEPQEILLVGDDRQNDFVGGREAGWQTVLVDRSRQERSDDVITSLRQLEQILPRPSL